MRQFWVPVMLAVGWLCLFLATALPLLAAIQVCAMGLGALLTAVLVAQWPRKEGTS